MGVAMSEHKTQKKYNFLNKDINTKEPFFSSFSLFSSVLLKANVNPAVQD